MGPARDQLQYVEVSLRHFTEDYLDTTESGGSLNKTREPSLSGIAGDSKSLCSALQKLAESSDHRFEVLPEVAEGQAHAPVLALFPNEHPAQTNSAWAWMVSPVDVVVDEAAAGFNFGPPSDSDNTSDERPPFLVDTDAGVQARRRLEECISEILFHQHRLHVFMLHIADSSARISRWDRAGCVVSEPVALSSGLFDELVARLARMSACDLGLDDKVKLATPQQISKLQRTRPKYGYLKECRDKMLKDVEAYPIYEISAPVINRRMLQHMHQGFASLGDDSEDEDCIDGPRQWLLGRSTQTKTYLIGRPLTTRRPLAGKCTMGFIGFDAAQDRFVFVKDQWRAKNAGGEELGTYHDLIARDIKGIAHVEAGGDVFGQCTRSHECMGEVSCNETAVPRVHVRLVSKTVGRPLKTFDSGEHLLRVVAQAVIVHCCAVTKAKILHSDISAGNIMIDARTGDGFLTDWDVSVPMNHIQHKNEREGFNGTWLFGAALALQYPKKPIEVEDDIEAFVWVIVYIAIHHMEHSLSKDEQKELVDKLFSAREVHTCDEDGRERYIGGALKLHYIQLGKPPVQLKDAANPVAVFLAEAFKFLKGVYAKVDYPAIEHWRSGERGPRSFVPCRGSKSVLAGLTHNELYNMLYKAGNYWAEYRRGLDGQRK